MNELNVGDMVELLRPSRHGILPRGAKGTVVEVRAGGDVCVDFPRAGQPDWKCIYPANRRPFRVMPKE